MYFHTQYVMYDWRKSCKRFNRSFDLKSCESMSKKKSLWLVEIFARSHRGTLLGSSRTQPQFKIFLQTAARNVVYVAVWQMKERPFQLFNVLYRNFTVNRAVNPFFTCLNSLLVRARAADVIIRNHVLFCFESFAIKNTCPVFIVYLFRRCLVL